MKISRPVLEQASQSSRALNCCRCVSRSPVACPTLDFLGSVKNCHNTNYLSQKVFSVLFPGSSSSPVIGAPNNLQAEAKQQSLGWGVRGPTRLRWSSSFLLPVPVTWTAPFPSSTRLKNDEDENRERWNKGREEETSAEIKMTLAAGPSLKFLATGV